MCCFSHVSKPASFMTRLLGDWAEPRVHVANTGIFARRLDPERQGLVYSMQLSVDGEVAMILPLPVSPGLGDDAVTFVNLERHADFFGDLLRLFFPPPPASAQPQSRSPVTFGLPKLQVFEVGSFEASFVPTSRDFERLDERFRLPADIWNDIGGYDDWGFAVFRLKPSKQAQIHPMALRFATRDEHRLFFPTVHVHDGKVHRSAKFDHTLYYQSPAAAEGDAPSLLVPGRDYEGLVDPARPVYRRELRGRLPNRDTWIEAERRG
jgi:hypothetical protein